MSAPSAPGAVEAARDEYADLARAVAYHGGWCETVYADGRLCPVCGIFSVLADAFSLAYDNAVAEALAGRRPRLWSREIPLG